MNSQDDDIKPSEPPPSYDEAISETITGNYSRPTPAPPQPPRPESLRPPQPPRPESLRPPQPPQPPRPPRPSNSSQLSHSTSHLAPSRPTEDTSSLYTTNKNLPFHYPKGFLCQKCRNSGYKTKNGKMCRDCWDRFYLKNNAYNPNPNLPFKFPKRHLCDKCNNTGYKLKNSRSCKDCWERYSPRNSYQPASSMLGFNPFNLTLTANVRPLGSFGPGPAPGPTLPPMRVNPGDPRIGGTLCGRCRGTGLITFFLDDEMCTVCNGIGRILNGPPMPTQPRPPPPDGPLPGHYASNNNPYMGRRKY